MQSLLQQRKTETGIILFKLMSVIISVADHFAAWFVDGPLQEAVAG